MTEPVWVPARPPSCLRSPGHTLCLGAAAAAALYPRGCSDPGSEMSPSGRLHLLIIVGLILITRGQTLEEATSISLAVTTTEDIHAMTQTPDTVHPELQTSTLQASEVTATQTKTQTQHLTGVDVLLTTTPGTEATYPADPIKGITPSKQSPDQDFEADPALRTTGSSEDDPFSYDEVTLRKHGLLVAAVLFITGIVILTSGKCRQLPQLCRNHNR
ncbi:FXYD domain-containing ion transport regulator 5 isoform X2 [Phyllostomus discolor]|uniref:FXYD domain-containing ion transport regulator n=1 Tax=Phyllostomus discolor TaxID=89673 RepID=A0A7E6CLE3_9CHIR|nr:FXYD domain-containing ion transport regulator 5 isoform X2 [Phyllostomus discolor]